MGNPVGPVSVPSMPGKVVDVTPDDAATFPASVIVLGAPGAATLKPASGGADVVWTSTAENFIVPGLYSAVKQTGTSATDIKRLQINE